MKKFISESYFKSFKTCCKFLTKKYVKRQDHGYNLYTLFCNLLSSELSVASSLLSLCFTLTFLSYFMHSRVKWTIINDLQIGSSINHLFQSRNNNGLICSVSTEFLKSYAFICSSPFLVK